MRAHALLTLVSILAASLGVSGLAGKAERSSRERAFETGRRSLTAPPVSGLAMAAPKKAKKPKSAFCVGLANYEIVRSSNETAACRVEGNRVLGGTCTGFDAGGPNADGTAWVCLADELAVAICAAVCSLAPEPEGACCVAGECSVLTASECRTQGGSYLGDGSECEDDACAPMGACCVEEEPLCRDDVTEAECEDLGGTYVGDDVRCDEDPAAICF